MLAVASMLSIANTVTHAVGGDGLDFWTDDSGYCKTIVGESEGVHRPAGFARLHTAVGDRLSFTFSTHHDLWSLASLEALEACDFAGGTLLANRMGGGGCDDEADLACMEAATPFVLRVNNSEKDLYLACNVSDHCFNGHLRLVVLMSEQRGSRDRRWCLIRQRLVVHTHEQRPLPPREVVVPLWTDDAGYCKPLPQERESTHVTPGWWGGHAPSPCPSPSLTCRRSSLATSPTQRRASTAESTI